MKKSKLGVGLLAAFAVMAVGASGAHATEWTAAEYPALISGQQASAGSTSFGFENSTTANCTTVGFAGELTKASSSLTVSPGFTECTAFEFEEATITPNECNFVLKPESGSSDSFSGKVDISCPEGKKIVFVGGNCETKIGAQTALGTVSYKNETTPTPDEVEATFSLTTVAYEKTKDGSGCKLTGTGSKTNGTLSGTVKLQAGNKSEKFNLQIK